MARRHRRRVLDNRARGNGNSTANFFEVRPDHLVLNTLPVYDHAIATRNINALGSGDTITVYGGSATIDGGVASDTLVATGIVSHSWLITDQNEGNLDGQVHFSRVEQLIGGNGADTFQFTNSARITGAIHGGGGSDLLIAAVSANTWTIDSATGGTVKNTIFTGFETLRGGSAVDTIRITPGTAFAGTLDGAGGIDRLDYSNYTAAVEVNLAQGTATGIGGVSGVEDITGGDGNDFLVGNAANNVIAGGKGDDVILGWSGNDSIGGSAGRDLVVGGSGSDVVHGNNLEDILVGGTLTYANESTGTINRTALNAIMAEWTRTDMVFILRVLHLNGTLSGGLNGIFVLNATTAEDDNVVDTLFGDASQDWFLSGNNDIVNLNGGDFVTGV